jgi:NTP pyrophosphatase (non-canonical NTP hydrolase)
MRDEMTFKQFQEMNRKRCEEAFPMCDDWGMNDWAVALAGEVGELCNLLKKVRRGDKIYKLLPRQSHWEDVDMHHARQTRRLVLSELADIITYADLLMSKLEANTEDELMAKFHEVSERVEWEPVH